MIAEALSANPFLYLLVPLAFLIGSIPFGLIFTRGSGVDIRSAGSKNIGATNVLRTAGKKPAILTLLGDILKGVLAVAICRIALSKAGLTSFTPEQKVIAEDFFLGLASLSAVAGHMFSIFLSFKGGKGVATGFGVLAVYSPAIAGIMFAIWLLTALTLKYSSLSAIIAYSAMPVLFYLSGDSSVKVAFGIILGLLVLYKHKGNIRNLLDGTETKIGKKK